MLHVKTYVNLMITCTYNLAIARVWAEEDGHDHMHYLFVLWFSYISTYARRLRTYCNWFWYSCTCNDYSIVKNWRVTQGYPL